MTTGHLMEVSATSWATGVEHQAQMLHWRWCQPRQPGHGACDQENAQVAPEVVDESLSLNALKTQGARGLRSCILQRGRRTGLKKKPT